MLFAIGHSTRSIEKFLEIVRAHQIILLVDIRTIPRSRHNPQFDQQALQQTLTTAGIAYRHLKGLGGLRKPTAYSMNAAWDNKSFRGYADYMQTSEFTQALDELIKLGSTTSVAFMCAEGNPFRCHRLLVADALTARGISVYHISSPRSKKKHSLTSFAKIQHDKVIYPSGSE